MTEAKPGKGDKEDSPSNNTTAIIIGVVVSVLVVVVVGVGAFVWHKRVKAKRRMSKRGEPMNGANGRDHGESFVELSHLRAESSF